MRKPKDSMPKVVRAFVEKWRTRQSAPKPFEGGENMLPGMAEWVRAQGFDPDSYAMSTRRTP